VILYILDILLSPRVTEHPNLQATISKLTTSKPYHVDVAKTIKE